MVNRSYTTQISGTPAITTSTETVILTTSGISTAQAGESVVIDGAIDVTAGTGTTAVVIKCRRGTTTAGTQVGASETDTLAAGNSEALAFTFQDTPGDVAGQQYVITATQTGGTANGTVNGGAATVTVGSP